jgi:hypothetical protein
MGKNIFSSDFYREIKGKFCGKNAEKGSKLQKQSVSNPDCPEAVLKQSGRNPDNLENPKIPIFRGLDMDFFKVNFWHCNKSPKMLLYHPRLATNYVTFLILESRVAKYL